MTAAAMDLTFTYATTTEWGNVFIVPTISGWYEVRFQERWQYDEELLGTFESVALAVEAARAGAVETPAIEVCLSGMGLPENVNDWVRHARGRS